MKLAKTLALSAFVAGSLAIAPSAMAKAGFYGHAHVNLEGMSDDGNDNSTLAITDGGSSPSRFGFKGSKKAGALTAGVQIEIGVNFSRTGSSTTSVPSDTLNIRQMNASLAGRFGKIVLGQTEDALAGMEETYWAKTWLADGPGRGASLSQGGFFLGAYRDHVIRFDSNKLGGLATVHLSLAPETGNAKSGERNQHSIAASVRASQSNWTAGLAYKTVGDAPNGSGNAESIILLNGAYLFRNILLDLTFSTRGFGKAANGSDLEDEVNFYIRPEYQTARGALGVYYSTRMEAGGAKDTTISGIGVQYRHDLADTVQTYVYVRSDSTDLPDGQTDPDSITTFGLGLRVQFGAEVGDNNSLSVM